MEPFFNVKESRENSRTKSREGRKLWRRHRENVCGKMSWEKWRKINYSTVEFLMIFLLFSSIICLLLFFKSRLTYQHRSGATLGSVGCWNGCKTCMWKAYIFLLVTWFLLQRFSVVMNEWRFHEKFNFSSNEDEILTSGVRILLSMSDQIKNSIEILNSIVPGIRDLSGKTQNQRKKFSDSLWIF